MASLQARHQHGCGLGRPWTTFAAATHAAGCTCTPGPMYHVVSPLAGGKLERRPVGRNRKDAERTLRSVQVKQDAGEYAPLREITFAAWADEWHAGLRRPKENTRRSYVSTLDYARRAFGDKKVRALTVADVERFLSLMVRTVKRDGELVEEPIAASTQAKHLRVLHACLASAVQHECAGRNPVEFLTDSHRPQPQRREAPYFTDDELAPLLAAALDQDRPLFRFALLTGMRQGEILGLTWRRVNLLEGKVHVREQHTPGIGVNAPKSQRSLRTVELPPEAVELLEGLLAGREPPADGELVFPGLFGPQYPKALLARLYDAMSRAGVPRAGEHLEPPTTACRTFHSLRHTYARRLLEGGAELSWLSRQLGHSSAAFTEQRYGHWSKQARRRELDRLVEAGAFAF